MKRFFIWAMAATLLVAGTAVAAGPARGTDAGRLVVQPNETFPFGSPATTNNDDSCDIAVTPAATLLLPYFEVDFQDDAGGLEPSNSALNTIFTITNVSRFPQIAHVTVWSDLSFPVLDFNIYLTGYDVQGVNLWDVIARGQLPGTSSDAAVGDFSQADNPNFLDEVGEDDVCLDLPTEIGDVLLAEVQSALTGGPYFNCSVVGLEHDNAIGYVTVDVAATCSQSLPTDPEYFATEILFDNVFIGDYQNINPNSALLGEGAGNYAGGSPMVHIRAVPEGGAAGTFEPTNLPYTFYDRYVADAGFDRRQPLPGLWAARYIEENEEQDFETDMLIWREGTTGGVEGSSTLEQCPDVTGNDNIATTELVRFDESENPNVAEITCRVSPCPVEDEEFTFPETSRTSTTNAGQFPGNLGLTEDAGGWMYLNLNNGGADAYSTDRTNSQNWVVVEMRAEGRYGVDFDAAYLGNGCSANPGTTDAETGPFIGPADNFQDAACLVDPTAIGCPGFVDPAL